MIPVIGPILELATEFLRLANTRAKIRLQRLALIELERIDDECDEIDRAVDKLLRAGRAADADRLLEQRSRRAIFRASCAAALFDVAKKPAGEHKGRDILPDTGRTMGKPSSATEIEGHHPGTEPGA